MAMVTGLQITMVIDGRSVSFNMQSLDKIDAMMNDGGSLGYTLRGFRDAYPGVIETGKVHTISTGPAAERFGQINVIQRPPRGG